MAATDVVGADSHATNSDGAVSVGTGAQLSTIIATTEDDVRTEVENTAVEARLDRDDETREALDDRAEVLRERATEIREEYQKVTDEYASGEISRSAYAQRLALLNARAENVLGSLDRLEARSANVSGGSETAGLNESTVEDVSDRLDEVSSAGPDAILEQFTGQRTGELELRVDDGVRIEAESEDGERSRELRRPDDGDDSVTVSQSDALSAARGELSAQNGTWRLTRASVHEDDGYYRFEFVLSAANETGEAEIRVDGSNSDVIRLEEEIERLAEEEREDEQEDEQEDRGEPTLLVADGTPAPNETVTLRVLVDGEPVEGATVTRDDAAVGQTGPDGTLEVTLPPGESEFETQVGDEDAELEFEFEEREEEDEEREDDEEDEEQDEEEEDEEQDEEEDEKEEDDDS